MPWACEGAPTLCQTGSFQPVNAHISGLVCQLGGLLCRAWGTGRSFGPSRAFHRLEKRWCVICLS